MRKGIVFLVSALLISTCFACSRNTGSNQGVVIRVGDRSITGEDITRIVKFTSLENGIPANMVWSSMNSLAKKIIDDSLILAYGKDRGIGLDEIELEKDVQDIVSDYPGESFKQTLLARCIDYSEWKEKLREQLLIRKIVRQRMKSIGPISYDAIRSHYEKMPEEFSHPPRVKFVHAIAATRSDAEALLTRIRGGEKIEEIVQGKTLGNGIRADLNTRWHSKDMLPPALSEAAFSVPVGEVSPIIQTPYGFHVIKVLQRDLAGRKDLMEVMSEIKETLLSREREILYDRWLEELRQHYPVTVNYALLDTIRMMNEDQ
jgi:parvulin-like peptidyl-prolyl isomerase